MKVHYIKTEKEYDIAFFPETKRFFRVNEKAQRIINDLLAKEDIKIIANREEVSVECIEEYAKKIEECTTRIKNKSNEQSNSNKLKRLVIHLANGCNLRCEYCYANGGTYHSDASMITHETIDRIFDIFYGSFDSIETIQLFGGEPLLNMDAVEYICEKVENICIDREKKTQIGIVTNGTLIDERFAELVQRYHILVTISYDGDIKVNDKLRKDVHGNGMSNLILKNAKMLKEKTGQPNTIEATYTQYHYNNGISLIDIIKHIYSELGTIGIHCVPAGGNEDAEFILKEYEPFIKGIDDVFEANKLEPYKNYSFSFAQRIMAGLAIKKSVGDNLCDAGDGTISVAVDGSIYPCFMLTDIDEYRLGNVFDDNPLKSKRIVDILEELKQVNRKNSKDCENCFAINLCTGCLGLNLLNTGSIGMVDGKFCDMYRKLIEYLLIKLSEKK